MELIEALQGAASPTLDRLMMIVTNLGAEEAYVAFLVVTFVAIHATVGRRLASYFLVAVYVMELLKLFFDMPRPFEVDPSVLRSQAAADTAGGSSFPSGHALSAMVFWGLAASYVRRSWFSLVAALIVGLVAVSRIYLGVHFPIDVVAGLVLGFAFVVAGRALDRVRWRLPLPGLVALALIVPLALHLLLPTAGSALYMGGLAAFLIGPELIRHRTDGPLIGRALLGLIGLALVFVALLGSSALIPDAIRHQPLFAFFRYLAVGAVGTLLVPYLGRAFRLVPSGRAPEPAVQGAPAAAE